MLEIEVWSDVVCPFCYIGKRHLEKALEVFPHREQVQVHWRSFELDPEAEKNPDRSLNELLARKYGQSVEWAKQMHDQMTEQAKGVGLEYRFDLAKPTNSFDAHRLIHLAEKKGSQDPAEERLFAAYYTRGEHIGDRETLQKIGVELGLNGDEVKQMLESDAFQEEVRQDETMALEFGVRGVPFFLFDRKYAVSGAQPVEVFSRALETAWTGRGGDDEPGKKDSPDEFSCGPEGCTPL